MPTAQEQVPDVPAAHLLRQTIRALIGVNHTNQRAVADALGIAQSGLTARLSGDTRFSENDLYRLAEFFGLDDPSELWRPAEAIAHTHTPRTLRRRGRQMALSVVDYCGQGEFAWPNEHPRVLKPDRAPTEIPNAVHRA